MVYTTKRIFYVCVYLRMYVRTYEVIFLQGRNVSLLYFVRVNGHCSKLVKQVSKLGDSVVDDSHSFIFIHYISI